MGRDTQGRERQMLRHRGEGRGERQRGRHTGEERHRGAQRVRET